MRTEEQYQDVLQNMEFAVIDVYRCNPSMTDYVALRVYESLVELYSAEVAGRPPKAVDLKGFEAELYVRVRDICEWRLGRRKLGAGEGEADMQPLDVPTIILCLKRLVKSVQRWNKHGGRQGYLSFVDQFIK